MNPPRGERPYNRSHRTGGGYDQPADPDTTPGTHPAADSCRAVRVPGDNYGHHHDRGRHDHDDRHHRHASHRLSTFAIPLMNAGYETGFFGKWHMGNDDTRRPGWKRG